MGKKYNARSVTLRLFTRFQAMKYTGKKNGLNTAMVLSRCSVMLEKANAPLRSCR